MHLIEREESEGLKEIEKNLERRRDRADKNSNGRERAIEEESQQRRVGEIKRQKALERWRKREQERGGERESASG